MKAPALYPQVGDSIVVWVSCGAASAVAAYITIEAYGPQCAVSLVNNPIAEEDPDNMRFLQDLSKWLNYPILSCINPAFPSASAREVWAIRGAMSFPLGAPCTVELKKRARQYYEAHHRVDWHVLGFTAEEVGRYNRFTFTERSNVLPILIDAGLTKDACARFLISQGLKLPRVYEEGYPNANCIGCAKATSPTYWNLVRRTRPEVFQDRAEQSRRLGCRLVRYKGQRIYLDELPEGAGGRALKALAIECGIFCEDYFIGTKSK